jgi:hypothetical protein
VTRHRSCMPRARRELRRSRPLEHRHSGCTGNHRLVRRLGHDTLSPTTKIGQTPGSQAEPARSPAPLLSYRGREPNSRTHRNISLQVKFKKPPGNTRTRTTQRTSPRIAKIEQPSGSDNRLVASSRSFDLPATIILGRPVASIQGAPVTHKNFILLSKLHLVQIPSPSSPALLLSWVPNQHNSFPEPAYLLRPRPALLPALDNLPPAF